MTEKNIAQCLDNFIDQYMQLPAKHKVEFDSDWLSPCTAPDHTDGEYVNWRPVEQAGENSFAGMEEALELGMNEQLKSYYCRYYADHFEAMAARGPLSLLQVWNKDDFERLQQNLVGHVLMKRKLKQAETLFFALTDEEDFIISVLNSTGEVVLERVGKEPQEVLATDLASFIAQLKPHIIDAE
ncbi:SecY-interacting protein [Alteromonas sp. ASW11-36]|uniref:Protein Syd n=1 Tax=Alteromonas arenosi TaxID=3055817 RepID=A0ABT7SVK6_9ALTE|nr:SecY-interacting protein [Alteromonas sp. ASW11-36]MDM7860227.1 SecY-interacting protein [Alteromonas sp. ASW11-36]